MNKELVILDDADEPSFPNGIEGSGIRYFKSNGTIRYRIPEKRNQVNALAQGEVIAHWDSDDWSDPQRMTDQLRRLEESGKQVTGYNTMLFYDTVTGKAYRYVAKPDYAFGTSQFYFKEWWVRHQFVTSKTTGSDNEFGRMAVAANQLACVEGGNLMVARIHRDNTSPKRPEGQRRFEPWTDPLPEGFIP